MSCIFERPELLEKVLDLVLRMEGFLSLWAMRRTCNIWNTTIIELVLQNLRKYFGFELIIYDQFNNLSSHTLVIQSFSQDGFFSFANHDVLLPDVAVCKLRVNCIQIKNLPDFTKDLFLDWKVGDIRLRLDSETQAMSVSSGLNDSKKGLCFTLSSVEFLTIVEDFNEKINNLAENEKI
ncbi:819_t:CDS:2 [Ambispora gerdemannii]|uniref:819_t:CDS:1 n=1 Tax=Ambispora gerdemannii TaxID=144530 RepID=A0A9N9DVR0_9GLOM|nr:819_t:CDS:2 [Ambispora gerdemannii]